jgi:hypothetical protein
MDLANMRCQGVHHLVAFCLNDACELVKDAVLFAIQTALGEDESGDAPAEPIH